MFDAKVAAKDASVDPVANCTEAIQEFPPVGVPISTPNAPPLTNNVPANVSVAAA